MHIGTQDELPAPRRGELGWFACSSKPLLPGVYRVGISRRLDITKPNDEGNYYSNVYYAKFDGKQWFSPNTTAEENFIEPRRQHAIALAEKATKPAGTQAMPWCFLSVR